MNIFKRHDWGKWISYGFATDGKEDIGTAEVLRRVCSITGDVQWKEVLITEGVPEFDKKLTETYKTNNHN